jgi:hypothetical protein
VRLCICVYVGVLPSPPPDTGPGAAHLLTHMPPPHTHTQVRQGLVPLIKELKARGKAPQDGWLRGDYDVDVQARLCREVGGLCWWWWWSR